MRSRYLLATMTPITILLLILGLRAASFLPAITAPSMNSPPAAQETLPEGTEAAVDPGAIPPGPQAEESTQVAPERDGQAVLERSCAQCHPTQWLTSLRKSRPDWEQDLVQMEAKGVLLGDREREILLDYLAGTENP